MFRVTEQGVAAERTLPGTAAQPLDKRHDLHPTPGAQQTVHAWHLLNDAIARTLRHAARGDESLAAAFVLRQVTQRSQRFLRGCLQETASVHDNYVGVLGD